MTYPDDWQLLSRDVLEDVFKERARQVQLHGHNMDTPNGTGPEAPWLFPASHAPAETVQRLFRQDYEDFEAHQGRVNWALLLREEVAEAMEADSEEQLAEELIQVAAVAVSWVEKIRNRAAQDAGDE